MKSNANKNMKRFPRRAAALLSALLSLLPLAAAEPSATGESAIHAARSAESSLSVEADPAAPVDSTAPADSASPDGGAPWSEGAVTWTNPNGVPETLRYLLRAPAGAAEAEDLPLIVYLHGGSAKGDDLSLLTEGDGFPQYLADGRLGDVAAYVVMPQLSQQARGWAEAAGALSALLDQLCAEVAIDPNAICLTGHSMGGTGCWAVAAAMPERFCCAVPLSGSIRISPENIAALSSLPVWAFVGDADDIVDPSASIRFVEALHAAGGDARVTVIPGADHFAVPQAYLNAEWDIVGWMLAQAQ